MKSIFIMLLTDINPDVYRTIAFILVLTMVMKFILSILKTFLNHKLKNKIIEKERSIEFVNSILQANANSELQNNIKWFSILLSTGIGLFVAERFSPLGIHSIAIMAISISIGFLAYSLYLKRIEKQD